MIETIKYYFLTRTPSSERFNYSIVMIGFNLIIYGVLFNLLKPSIISILLSLIFTSFIMGILGIIYTTNSTIKKKKIYCRIEKSKNYRQYDYDYNNEGTDYLSIEKFNQIKKWFNTKQKFYIISILIYILYLLIFVLYSIKK